MSAIPVLIIGRNPKIASKVREGLLPEYDGKWQLTACKGRCKISDQCEVIHIILSVEQGVKDLPLLLSSPPRTPENVDGNFGSRNYGARPLAVGVGGGFNNEMLEEMRNACKDVDEGIMWVSRFSLTLNSEKIRCINDMYRSEPMSPKSLICRISATLMRMAPRPRNV
jgi:hypothetical protein